MENTWGTQEEQAQEPPSRADRAELILFTTGAVCLTASLVALAFQHSVHVELARGLYSVLAAGIVIGIGGWVITWSIGCVERRVKRSVVAELAGAKTTVDTRLTELTNAVHALADQVAALKVELARSQVTRLPTAQQRVGGHRYFGAAAVGAAAGDTVSMRTGLDPQAIADARTIARRLVDADTLPRQDHRL